MGKRGLFSRKILNNTVFTTTNVNNTGWTFLDFMKLSLQQDGITEAAYDITDQQTEKGGGSLKSTNVYILGHFFKLDIYWKQASIREISQLEDVWSICHQA